MFLHWSTLVSFTLKKKIEQKIIPSKAPPLLSILLYFINFEATHFQSSSGPSLILQKSHENVLQLFSVFFSLLSILFPIHPNTLLLTLGLEHRAIGLSILFKDPVKGAQSFFI